MWDWRGETWLAALRYEVDNCPYSSTINPNKWTSQIYNVCAFEVPRLLLHDANIWIEIKKKISWEFKAKRPEWIEQVLRRMKALMVKRRYCVADLGCSRCVTACVFVWAMAGVLTLLMLSSGMFQRLEKLRKNAFASVIVSGVDNDNVITGLWIMRGHELAFTVSAKHLVTFYYSILSCVFGAHQPPDETLDSSV